MNKLNIEYIESLIVKEEYLKLGKKTTICHLTLKNNFEVVGVSGVVNHKDFDLEIGKQVARERAVNQIWLIEGYLLQEKMNTK